MQAKYFYCLAAAFFILPNVVFAQQGERGPTVSQMNAAIAGAASAQIPAGTSTTTPLCPTGVAGVSAQCVSVSALGINLNAASGALSIVGVPTLHNTSAASEQSVFSGPYAGASQPQATGQFLVGLGWSVFESATALTPESSAIGSAAAIAMTTGGGTVAIGTSACAGQTTGACTAVGQDSGRDLYTVSGDYDILLGPGTLNDGTDNGDNIAIGAASQQGAASTITIGGALTANDVLTFTPSSVNNCNGTTRTINCTSGTFPATVYTVTSSDVSGGAATLASHITTALNSAYANSATINYILGDGVLEANHNLFVVSFGIQDATNYPTVIKGHYPGSWQLSFAYSCAGTCGETATINNLGYTGSANITIGSFTMAGVNAGGSISNIVIGTSSVSEQAGAVSYNTIVAQGAANTLSTQFESVFGFNAGASLTVNPENSFFGAKAGYYANGYGNSVFGSEAGSGTGCITSGGFNLELGAWACVASPTASHQISIANTIYNNSAAVTIASGFGTSPTAPTEPGDAAFHLVVGTGGTASTGVLTFANAAPHGWACSANDETTTSSTVFMTKQTGHTATTATFTQYAAAGTASAWTAGDTITFRCSGY